MTRKVIFVPDDYWTQPPKEHNMTAPIAADNRRATSLVVHYGNEELQGVDAIENLLDPRVTGEPR